MAIFRHWRLNAILFIRAALSMTRAPARAAKRLHH